MGKGATEASDKVVDEQVGLAGAPRASHSGEESIPRLARMPFLKIQRHHQNK